MPLVGPSPSTFHLAPDEVHCWCASLDVPSGTLARLATTLAPEERSRSARFRFERDRQRFIVARAVLRDLLARYLKTEPDLIRLAYNPFGKPALGPGSASGVTFNLSHSAGLAVVAITSGSPVGVDIERIRWESDCSDIARHFFAVAEIEHLTAIPPHLYAHAFFTCWTRKEAYIKARGQGLALPLNAFSVPVTVGAAHAPADLEGWSLYSVQPAPGYAGALVVEGSGWRVRQRHWNPGTSGCES